MLVRIKFKVTLFIQALDFYISIWCKDNYR